MPIKVERSLKRSAKKLGLGKARKAAYVYGTLAKIKKARKAKHAS